MKNMMLHAGVLVMLMAMGAVWSLGVRGQSAGTTTKAADLRLPPASAPAAVNPTAAAEKRLATIAVIAQLKKAITMFEVDNGNLPNTLQDLVERPKGDSGSWTKLLDKLPKDGWGNDFWYRTPSTIDPDHNDFDVVSAGPDGKFGTADDIDQTARK